MTRKWDELRAEFADTVRSQPHARKPASCIYCGTPTRALSGVCLAHSDLPKLDPAVNVQAGKYQRATS